MKTFRSTLLDWEKKWEPWGLETLPGTLISGYYYRKYYVEMMEMRVEVRQDAYDTFGPLVLNADSYVEYLYIAVGSGPTRNWFANTALRDDFEKQFPGIFEEEEWK